MYVLVCYEWEAGLSYRLLTPFCHTDVSESHIGRGDNCCDKHVSFSCKRWLSRSVRHSSLIPYCLLDNAESLILLDGRSRSHDTPLGSVRAVSDLRHRSGLIPLNRIEVSVRTEHDKFPISYVSTDQGRYRSHEMSLSGDAESGPEKSGRPIA